MSDLKEGMRAPDFFLPTNMGNEIALPDFLGKKLVLYFYPKDDTPGCTLEAQDFTRHMEKFRAANCEIVGISRDDLQSHGKFADKYCLPFALASDLDGKVCKSYGVWVEKSTFGTKSMGIERSTFLIDERGDLRKIWRAVKVDGHVEDILRSIQY